MKRANQARGWGERRQSAELRPGEYLCWYDRNPKKAIQARIDEAVEAFREKFGRDPEVCLVHQSELLNHPHVRVVAATHLRPGYYWLGWELEALDQAS